MALPYRKANTICKANILTTAPQTTPHLNDRPHAAQSLQENSHNCFQLHSLRLLNINAKIPPHRQDQNGVPTAASVYQVSTVWSVA